MSLKDNARLGGALGIVFGIAAGCSASPRQAFTVTPEPTTPDADGGATSSGFNPGMSNETPTGDRTACATGKASLQPVPLYAQFIVDGSSSMKESNKWTAFSQAFKKFVDDLMTKNDPMFGVGLFLFDLVRTNYTAIDVPIHVVDSSHARALKARIDGIEFLAGTPLKNAFEGQLPLLKAFAPSGRLAPLGRRLAIVVSDGVPNGSGEQQEKAKRDIVALARDARSWAPNITTFAVGVGNPSAETYDYDETFIGDLAIAGGEATTGCTPGWNQSSPQNAVPCHFQITPGEKSATQLRDEFLAMMRRIQGTLSCSLQIGAPEGGASIDPSAVNVVIVDDKGRETTLLQDAKDGWTYDDPQHPTRVDLHGVACDNAQRLVGVEVRVTLGCKTMVK